MSKAPGAALVMLLAVMAPIAAAQDSSRALAEDIPPAGYGTLHRDDIDLRLQVGDIQVTVLPLDERVIRLLAPDSYRALAGLKRFKADTIARAARQYGITRPGLFVVTFFGLRERARFIPEDVTIQSRGRFFRPIAIIPLAPRWSEQVLGQRETTFAIYLYEEDIEVLEPFTMSYAGFSTATWERVLRRLDAERAAVRSRAAARKNP